MSPAILFNFLRAQHVSDINISIIRSLRLFCWITTLVVLFLVLLLMMDILMSETCWARKKWNKIASDIKLVFYSSPITMMHGPIYIRLPEMCKLKKERRSCLLQQLLVKIKTYTCLILVFVRDLSYSKRSILVSYLVVFWLKQKNPSSIEVYLVKEIKIMFPFIYNVCILLSGTHVNDNTIQLRDGSRYSKECKKIIISNPNLKKLQNEVVSILSRAFIITLYQHTLSKSHWWYEMWNILWYFPVYCVNVLFFSMTYLTHNFTIFINFYLVVATSLYDIAINEQPYHVYNEITRYVTEGPPYPQSVGAI